MAYPSPHNPRYNSRGIYATATYVYDSPKYYEMLPPSQPDYEYWPQRFEDLLSKNFTYKAAENTFVETPQKSCRRSRKPLAKKAPRATVTPTATEAAARRWKIPAVYSLKYWDPTESPILVFYNRNAMSL